MINKSSRHSKIAGDFGEDLILYWLSKNGFETALLDHTGIDLLSYHSETNRRLGISVKTRTREMGTENEGVYIKVGEIGKIKDACKAFEAEPFVGIVVDKRNQIELFVISLDAIIKINDIGTTYINVKVKESDVQKYKQQSDLLYVKLDYKEILRFESPKK
jgi:Holliday junction resolvase